MGRGQKRQRPRQPETAPGGRRESLVRDGGQVKLSIAIVRLALMPLDMLDFP